jgi:transposase
MIHGYEPTQHYLTRRRGQQKSDAEIRRRLKRRDCFSTGLLLR